MQPKSILAPVTESAHISGHLAAAADLAQRLDAHLDVLALGVDTTQAGYFYPADAALMVHDSLATAQADAMKLRDASVAALQDRNSLRWTVEDGAASYGDVGRSVASLARYSDLTILPQPYRHGGADPLEAMVEGALFDGMARVIVLPEEAELSPPKRIMLAWNDSPEAFAAARGSLPLLAQAESVAMAIVDPPQHGRNRSDPGGAMAEFLARHGVRVEIDLLSKTLPRVSDVLMRHASDVNADMIVMGAYGHSRFRESLLGGATRHMLEHADRPVFMAHH